jgi:uncharacterized damage-inducible protein DinB
MSAAIGLEYLLDYSDHERRKWLEWLNADPSRLALPLQMGGRFTTVQALLDHVFLVERRHLSRLEGGTPPESSGVSAGDVKALFEYADLVRRDFRKYLTDLSSIQAYETMTVTTPMSGTHTLPRVKLAAHIVLHEVRHLAQLALAARNAGHPPPGEHDLFFFPRHPSAA